MKMALLSSRIVATCRSATPRALWRRRWAGSAAAGHAVAGGCSPLRGATAAAGRAAWLAPRRAMSEGPTVMNADELGGMGEDEYRDKVRQLHAEVNADVAGRLREMQRLFGGEPAEGEELQELPDGLTPVPMSAVTSFMTSYYRLPHPEFVVPAIVSMCSTNQLSPAQEAAAVTFFSRLLRASSHEVVVDTWSRAVMAHGVRTDLVLSVLQQTRVGHEAAVEESPLAAAHSCLERLQASVVDRAAGSTLASWANSVAAAKPDADVLSWRIPFADLEGFKAAEQWDVVVVAETAEEAPLSSFTPTHYLLETRHTLAQRSEDGFYDWAALASTVWVESMWHGFFATGDSAYLRRVLEATAELAPFMDKLEAHHLASLESPLPDGLVTDRNSATVVQCARVAAWSLLAHCHSHPAVMRAVAEEVSYLADHIVPEGSRDGQGRIELTATEAAKRAQVLPGILYVMSQFGPWAE